MADRDPISAGSSALRRLGPQSRAIDRGAVGWSIDGRSREGRFLNAYELMLRRHLGGSPSRVQREMIRRCARLALHLELQDEKLLFNGEWRRACPRQSHLLMPSRRLRRSYAVPAEASIGRQARPRPADCTLLRQ